MVDRAHHLGVIGSNVTLYRVPALRGVLFALFSLSLVNACKRDPAPRPPERRATPNASPPATDEESAAPSGPPLPSSPPSGAQRLLELACVDTRISSSMGAEQGGFRGLVDRDDASAWVPREGETVGAWAEYEVPEGVEVGAFRLLLGEVAPAGVARVVRPRQVRVTRDGNPVGEFDVDPRRRTAQFIPATGGAGLWRVEVIAATSLRDADGGAPALLISDLQPWGSPAPGLNASSCEVVPQVGPSRASAEGLRVSPPAATLAAWCDRFRAGSARDGGSNIPGGDASVAACSFGAEAEVTPSEGTTLRGPHGGSILDAQWLCTRAPEETATRCRLAVRSRFGWMVSDPLARAGAGDTTAERWTVNLYGWRAETPDGAPAALLVHYNESVTPTGADTHGVTNSKSYLLRCDVTGAGAFRCDRPHRSALRLDTVR